MKKSKKEGSEMTTEGLREATKEYDQPFGGWEEFKPLRKKDRELHRIAALKKYDEPFVALNESKPLTVKGRAAHRRAGLLGRPRMGKGAKRVLITVERGLLKDMDQYAKQTGISRSQLIAQGVRSILAKRAG